MFTVLSHYFMMQAFNINLKATLKDPLKKSGFYYLHSTYTNFKRLLKKKIKKTKQVSRTLRTVSVKFVYSPTRFVELT